jgi:hypothetical protein
MWNKFPAAILALAATVVAASTCAMSAPHPQPHGPCRVIGGDKLPAESGGAAALCATVEHAVAARAPTVRYSAEIRVVSKSALAANLVAHGRKLPEQNFSIVDRNLNPGSIQRFAETLAELIAKAPRG